MSLYFGVQKSILQGYALMPWHKLRIVFELVYKASLANKYRILQNASRRLRYQRDQQGEYACQLVQTLTYQSNVGHREHALVHEWIRDK